MMGKIAEIIQSMVHRGGVYTLPDKGKKDAGLQQNEVVAVLLPPGEFKFPSALPEVDSVNATGTSPEGIPAIKGGSVNDGK